MGNSSVKSQPISKNNSLSLTRFISIALISPSSKGGIHAKRERDEDARRLKVIQDLIFEDGDLDADGGEGRALNFRWKNIDDANDENDDVKGADDDDDDEDVPLMQTMEETETLKKWRKRQFEREQWKKEQSKNKEVSDSCR